MYTNLICLRRLSLMIAIGRDMFDYLTDVNHKCAGDFATSLEEVFTWLRNVIYTVYFYFLGSPYLRESDE